MTDENDIYSDEEIELAKEDIKKMTPEELLDMKAELHRAYANQNMPEAVSIVFTEIYSSKGNKINITCRGMTGRMAIDELADALRYAKEKYNMSVGRPQPAEVELSQPIQSDTEPHYVDVAPAYPQSATAVAYAGTAIDDIQVISITRERKQDGKGDFLRVRGGSFTKYGAPAYDNVFPKGFDASKLQYGVEVTPPQGMMNAKIQSNVDQDGKKSKAKVTQFS